jgi:hypothetical protein
MGHEPPFGIRLSQLDFFCKPLTRISTLLFGENKPHASSPGGEELNVDVHSLSGQKLFAANALSSHKVYERRPVFSARYVRVLYPCGVFSTCSSIFGGAAKQFGALVVPPRGCHLPLRVSFADSLPLQHKLFF